MNTLVLVGSMLILAFLGVPIVFAMLGASLLTIAIYRPFFPDEIFAQYFVAGVQNYPLLALGFFFLVGEWMNSGGITQRIVTFANSLVGHIRGGLAQTNIASSMMFAGISGSALADTAALGSVLIPSMKKSGYGAGFSAAVTQTSAVIGPIIPPSIPMIVFAFLAEVSIGQMFVAGILPGLLVGVGLMAVAYVISSRRGYPVSSQAGPGEIWRSFVSAIAALLAPVLIIGGVLGGVFTATEAGAVAALYAFVIGRFWLRELSWTGAARGLVRAATGTGQVLVILGAASLFAFLIAEFRVSQDIANLVFSISDRPWVFLLLLNVTLLIIGLFLENLPVMIIMVPIFYPIALELGIDPIHFGIVFVLTSLIGLCTPPIGILIYMSATLAGCRPEEVIRESLPFIAVLIGAVLVVTFVPAIALTLPELFFDRSQP
ncbi:TRAP transporter large permease [Psychromarinibacter sp. C21-152]|uniref:TRAP transporter large permease protein n=1 Tax=Psychromarinibacter sediminicola TaxID=3033385 RepID=A0AAE3T6V8_9RHOB|nr:TRAP transporter large permease [Psychromarinibacter sediminicola]MDF0599720.1 TRAP transporter large permease [Psychromarinibacter sediminicola]